MQDRKPMPGWIYGLHSVEAVLAARPEGVKEIAISAHAARAREIVARLPRGVAVREVLAKDLAALTGTDSHQGLAARAELPGYADLDEVMERPPHVIVVLDGITDPMNLGAIIRTAEALGASGAVVGKDRSAGISATAHKASAGALEFLPLCQEVNLARALRRLKDRGYWIYGADSNAQLTVNKAEFTGKTALVIGSEGQGIRPGVAKEMDFLVKIPQAGKTLSLNAGVACAIILAEILKRAKT